MESGSGDNSCRSNGIILGCWDHQNTAMLIKELEETVETAEKKCISLMQQLVNYKKHYVEQSCKRNPVRIVQMKKKNANKHKVINSSSDNYLSLKSLVIDEDQIFYEKLKNKILEVNDEITYANLKMGLKDSNFLFSTDKFKENLKVTAEVSNGKDVSPAISLDSENFKDICNNHFKSTKSDPVLGENDKNEILKKYDYSKITKDELTLYQSLSKKNILDNNYQIDESHSPSVTSLSQKFRSKSLPQSSTSRTERDKIELSRSEQLCNRDEPIQRWDLKSKDSKRNTEIILHDNSNSRKSNNVHRKDSKNPIPFTVCSSTSRSFNVGVNIQRCISLIKEKKIKPTTDATINISVPDNCLQAISNLLIAASNSKEDVLSLKRNIKEDLFNDDAYSQFTKAVNLMFGDVKLDDLQKTEQSCGGKINSPPNRKQRCKYTNRGKIEEKTCCKKERKRERFKNLADGDNNGELKTELTSIHDDFLNLHRKYSLLRGQISKNLLSESEINAELDVRAMEYEDLINLYGQLLSSKQRFENFESSQFEKVSIPSTSTVTLTKVLRQIQNLQEKIKHLD